MEKGPPKSDEKVDAFLGAVLENKWRGRRKGGGRWGLELGNLWQALRKSRARRAPCQRQGAADLKAAPLPPAPFLQFVGWWTLFW